MKNELKKIRKIMKKYDKNSSIFFTINARRNGYPCYDESLLRTAEDIIDYYLAEFLAFDLNKEEKNYLNQIAKKLKKEYLKF